MPSHPSADEPASTPRDGGTQGTLELVADLFASLVLVLVGALAATGGYLLYDRASQDLASRIVAEMGTRSTVLTTPELVDALYETMVWGGLGLVATGLLLAGGGLAFLVYSAPVRGRYADDYLFRPDAVTAVVLGGLATIVVSFVPLSPLVGGAVAGYLHRDGEYAGVGIGSLAGLAVAVPFAVVLGSLTVGILASGATPIALVVAVATAFAVAYAVGLSALGGYLGDRLAERGAV